MTDDDSKPYDRNRSRTNIARDLSRIEDLFMRLFAEAVHHGDNAHMPGGEAMVMIGPGADLEACGYREMSDIIGRTQGAIEEQLKSDIEPPLSFLASWSDIVRADRGQPPSDKRASIGGEIAYLRSALDWMLATDETGAPLWEPALDFENGLRRVRRAMEIVLRAHEQIDLGASCLQCDRPLVRKWASGPNMSEYDDIWKCENRDCDADVYRYGQYMKALENEYLDKAQWLTSRDIERRWRVPASTVQTWAARGYVRRRYDIWINRRVYCVSDVLEKRDTENAA